MQKTCDGFWATGLIKSGTRDVELGTGVGGLVQTIKRGRGLFLSGIELIAGVEGYPWFWAVRHWPRGGLIYIVLGFGDESQPIE